MKFTTIYRVRNGKYRLRKNDKNEDLVIFDLHFWIIDLLYKYYLGPIIVILVTWYGYSIGETSAYFLISLILIILMILYSRSDFTLNMASTYLVYSKSKNEIINLEKQRFVLEGDFKYEIIFEEDTSNLRIKRGEEIYVLFPDNWIPLEQHDLWKVLQSELEVFHSPELITD